METGPHPVDSSAAQPAAIHSSPDLGSCQVCGGFVWKWIRHGYFTSPYLPYEKFLSSGEMGWRDVYACTACLASASLEQRPRIRAGAATGPRPLVPAETTAEQLLRINRAADVAASSLANSTTHLTQWTLYRKTIFAALLQDALQSPVSAIPALGASGAGDFSLSPAQTVAVGEATDQSSYWRGLDKRAAAQAGDTCEDGGVE